MKEYHTEITIDAPPQKVWEVLADVDRYGKWNPLVGKFQGALAQGERIQVHIKPLNNDFKAILTVVKPNEELRWVGQLIAPVMLRGDHYYRLEPEGENQTRLHHRETFTGFFAMFLSERLMRRMEESFQAHNEALKKRVETL